MGWWQRWGCRYSTCVVVFLFFQDDTNKKHHLTYNNLTCLGDTIEKLSTTKRVRNGGGGGGGGSYLDENAKDTESRVSKNEGDGYVIIKLQPTLF